MSENRIEILEKEKSESGLVGMPENWESLVIQISRYLVPALWQANYNENQYRLFNIYFSRLNIQKPEVYELDISKSEFEKITGVPIKREKLVNDVIGMAKTYLHAINPVTHAEGFGVTMFSKAEVYRDKETGELRINLIGNPLANDWMFFSPDEVGYIKELLLISARIKGKYIRTFMEYLLLNAFRREWTEKTAYLRKICNLENSKTYSQFKYFKRDILDTVAPALMEMGFKYTVTSVQARNVSEVKFIVSDIPAWSKSKRITSKTEVDNDSENTDSSDKDKEWKPLYDDMEYQDYIYNLREISGGILTLQETELVATEIASHLNIDSYDLQLAKFSSLITKFKVYNSVNPVKNKLSYILKMVRNEQEMKKIIDFSEPSSSFSPAKLDELFEN